MASKPSKASPKSTPPHPPAAKGPKPGATNFISTQPPVAEGSEAPAVKPPPRVLPKAPIVKPVTPAAVSSPPPVIRPTPDPLPSTPSVSDVPSDCLPITFDDEASCIVIGESEYYYSSRDAIATVGQLCSFLEAQDDFRGRAIQPLSSRARKIGSREAKSTTVSFIKIEDAVGSRIVAAAAMSPPPSSQPSPVAKPSPMKAAPSAAPSLSSVERAKLAALERFKSDHALKEHPIELSSEDNSATSTAKPPAKVSNKELLQGLDDEEEGDKELNFGKFGKTVAPPGRRLPGTRYRKHLEDLKKRSKRMEYRQKFFVMEKEKKQEELQKRLDEIDEENLRAERERRKKQEEEYDSLYGAELERKKKLQASSMASMLDELDSLGGGDTSEPSAPMDPDAAMFALTPGFSERQEENELPGAATSSGASRPQGRQPKQRLTLMLKDMLNSEDEPTSKDAIVDFSALARAPKKAVDQDAKERKLEELRQRKEELRRREEELNAQLANRPASATTTELLSGADEEAGFKTIMVQGRPRRVPVSASSATLVGSASVTAPVGSGRRVK